jgi:signal transduction histidine kinase/DNA-binding response OmpR family regulator
MRVLRQSPLSLSHIPFHSLLAPGFLLSLVLLTTPWGDVRAQDPAGREVIVTPAGPGESAVGPFMEILDEPAAGFALQSLDTPDVSGRFRPLGDDRVVVRGDRWLRLRVRSTLDEDETMILTFDQGRIPHLTIYAPRDDGSFRISDAGSLTPCNRREVCSRFPSFVVEIRPGAPTTIYLRASATSLFSATPRLRTVQNFAQSLAVDRMTYGAQYGIIAALVLFHLALYLFSRMRATLFLALFLAAAGLYGGLVEGTLIRALPLELTSFDREVLKRVLEALAFLFLLRFGSAHLLDDAPGWVRTRQAIRILTAVAVVAVPIVAVTPMDGIWVNGVVGVLVLVTLLYLSMLTSREASWPGRLHGVGILVLVAGFGLYALSVFAVARSASDLIIAVALPLDLYGLPTTVALFAVFGTMAVVRELYRVRRERDVAQASTLQQLLDDKVLREQWNVHLEREIVKRTGEVERAKTQLEHQNFELRRHERQLEGQAQQLQELQAHKSRFFAYISHEFRTPITLIRARVEDIVSDFAEAKPQDTRRRLDTVLQNTYRLEHLVDEVLDLSRVEEGTAVIRASRSDLAAFARRVVEQHVQLAGQKGIDLEYRSQGDGIDAYFDEEMMTKVITNLLSNAIKFSDRGGRIEVWVSESAPEPDAGYVRVDVVDQGPGIHRDDLPHVFERFFQSVRPGTQPRIGHGLGLSLTKHLVELHGGEVRVVSDEGEGSTFSIFLPKGRAHLTDAEIVPERLTRAAAAVVEPDLELMRGAGGQPRLLIVEDEPELLSLLREHFEKEYDVATAIDGQDGLKAARDVRPELIITDVLMPRMDGLEMLAAIRRETSLENIPVLILSAKASIEDRLTAYQAAADGYISKPFDMTELRIRVRNIIRSRRALMFTRSEAAISVDGRDLPADSVDATFIASARAAVMAHLDQDDFDVEAFAGALNMSSRTLHRRMKEIVSMAPAEFVRMIRLQAARHLIEQNAVGTVSEAATRVGFKSASHFARLYREVFGESPTDLLNSETDTPH